MENLIKSMYPLSYEDYGTIYSRRGLIADIDVRIRGWGWIQYLGGKMGLPIDAGRIQDDLGVFIAKAINEKIERDIIK